MKYVLVLHLCEAQRCSQLFKFNPDEIVGKPRLALYLEKAKKWGAFLASLGSMRVVEQFSVRNAGEASNKVLKIKKSYKLTG